MRPTAALRRAQSLAEVRCEFPALSSERERVLECAAKGQSSEPRVPDVLPYLRKILANRVQKSQVGRTGVEIVAIAPGVTLCLPA